MKEMEPIQTEAQLAEASAVSSKLTDMGLHRHSQEISNLLDSQIQAEASLAKTFARIIDDLNLRAQALEARILRDHSRADEANKKRCSSKLKSILDEIGNERGPWGSGSDDHANVRKFQIYVNSATNLYSINSTIFNSITDTLDG